MTFRSKMLAIALIPLIAVSVITAFIMYYQANKLAVAEIRTAQTRLLTSKRQELRNYVHVARGAIWSLYQNESEGRTKAQDGVKALLNNLTFDTDGYFFVYDENGKNLVHRRLRKLVGRNVWNLRDANGDLVIQNLIRKAKSGGDFHRYVWTKPSNGQVTEKLGYAVYLPKWGWTLGTGLYLDDIDKEVATLIEQIRSNIRETATLLFLISFLAVVVVAGILIFVRFSEQNLADSRLKNLSKRIVEIQEEERKRVSKELHDGISQFLISVRYMLDRAFNKAENREARDLVAQSMTILDSTVSEVRRISMDLRPSILDDMGLAAAITSICTTFQNRTGIAVTVQADRLESAISDDAKITLYRVTQEALTNIIRHAEASQVTVTLTKGQRVTLSIRDNGKGFSRSELRTPKPAPAVASTSGGMGLRNIRERVELNNGTLAIQGTPGQGTRIDVSLPITLQEKQKDRLRPSAVSIKFRDAIGKE